MFDLKTTAGAPRHRRCRRAEAQGPARWLMSRRSSRAAYAWRSASASWCAATARRCGATAIAPVRLREATLAAIGKPGNSSACLVDPATGGERPGLAAARRLRARGLPEDEFRLSGPVRRGELVDRAQIRGTAAARSQASRRSSCTASGIEEQASRMGMPVTALSSRLVWKVSDVC